MEVAEPWEELKATRPTVEVTAPAAPRYDFRALRLAALPPPRPRPASGWARRQVARLDSLWRRETPAAARALAGTLVAAPRVQTRDLAALGQTSCIECAVVVVDALRSRLTDRRWAWKETRWLLPLGGHPSERVRAAVLGAFSWAATRLGAGALKRQLEHYLRVFRFLVADPSPWVRTEALQLLGRLHDRVAHNLLMAATRDPLPAVRLAAVDPVVEAIGLVPGAPSTTRVCQLLGDPSPTVRATVLVALPRTKAPCGLEDVVRALDALQGLQRR